MDLSPGLRTVCQWRLPADRCGTDPGRIRRAACRACQAPCWLPCLGRRAALAKRRELAAHLRAIKLHEQAAELQERLGYSDRAARARVHAEHARELHARARQEQREHEGVDAGRWVVG